jgi:hypothetical protein
MLDISVLAPFLLAYLAMSNKQKARQWDYSMGQDQNAATTNQNVRLARAGSVGERRDEPLNVLGCLALIHAIRSVDSGERSQVGAGCR